MNRKSLLNNNQANNFHNSYENNCISNNSNDDDDDEYNINSFQKINNNEKNYDYQMNKRDFNTNTIDHHHNRNHHQSTSSSLLLSSSSASPSTTTTTSLSSSHTQIQNQMSSSSKSSWKTKLSELTTNHPGYWDYTIELECIQGPEDLQLAAELGKTLLERNKELETALKHHQNIIDDQAQEIEYLQKQTAALREVNDSRLRIYEQLEVGIQELERANHRLIAENSADKKQIKSLQLNIENLETKCEELCKNLEDAKKSLVVEKRKTDKLLQERANNSSNDENRTTYGILHSSTINDSQHYFDEDKTPNKNEQKQNNKVSNEMNRSENDDNFIDESTIIDSTGIIDDDQLSNKEDTEMIRILTELETTKKAFLSEQQRVTELEEQLVTIIQENQSLQSRLAQTGSSEEMRSVHDELSILEEVRQGTMCSRCLRSVNDKSIADDNLSTLESDGEIDIGVSGNGGSGVENISETLLENKTITNNKNTIKPTTLDLNQTLSSTNNVNPYRQLVEKYEALLEVHKHSTNRNLNRKQQQHQQQQHQQQQNTFLSDDGGQTSGEFSSINVKESLEDELNACNADKQENDINKNNNNNKTIKNSTITTRSSKKNNNNNNKLSRRTPTDLSETETLSSGFSDEICHKYTQTDERQGYFLCSIGDGEDCKFSIYDDVSPIDSRFRNRPEYRELFKEIFAVLKKAAENKEEGESLPLLDDNCPNSKVPPVTPANEDPPSFCDDTQSVISSAFSEQSVAISECVTKIERKTAKKHLKTQDKSQLRTSSCSFQAINTPTNTSSNLQQINENGRILTPLKREPLEYVQVGVGVRKKNRRKHRNSSFELSESPILPSPPKVYFGSGKKRKDFRPYIPNLIQNQPQQQQQQQSSFMPKTHQEWSGHSMIIYNRNMQSQSSPSQSFLCGGGGVVGDLKTKLTTNTPLNTMSNFEYKPSTVSQDLHKLKKLDLSYAEVLRRADACKHHHRK